MTAPKEQFFSPTLINLLAQQIFIESLRGAGGNAVNSTARVCLRGRTVQRAEYSDDCTAYVKVAKRINVKSSHHEKTFCNYVR